MTNVKKKIKLTLGRPAIEALWVNKSYKTLLSNKIQVEYALQCCKIRASFLFLFPHYLYVDLRLLVEEKEAKEVAEVCFLDSFDISLGTQENTSLKLAN